MDSRKLIASVAGILLLSGTAFADVGDRIDRKLDPKGQRIDRRHDRRVNRRSNG